MKTMISIIAVSILAVATPAVAAENFTGTWKYDIKTAQMSKKPSVSVIKDGSYTCSSCVPPYTVKADGAFYKVAGNPYYDEVSVKIVDPSTITWSSTKSGKPMAVATRTLAKDGKTEKTTFKDTSAPNGVPIVGTTVEQRVAPAPAGSHAISGSWLDTNTAQVSDAGLTIMLKLAGDMFTMSTPTGISYTAKVGGPASPVVGDPGWTSASLKRTAPSVFVETDYRADKVIGVYTYTLAADGKSIKADADDRLHNTKSSATLLRQ